MKYISLDIETDGLKMDGGIIWMLSITRGRKSELFEDCWGLKGIPARVKKELEDQSICKIIHSAVFDSPFISFILKTKIKNIWDTETIEVVIQGKRVSFGKKKQLEDWQIEELKKYSSKLKYVVPRYGFPTYDKDIVENFIGREPGLKFTKEEKDYPVNDTKYLPMIREMQEHILRRDDLMEVALLENKTAEKLAAMRLIGIGIDSKHWKRIADANEKEFERRMRLLPSGINWNAPGQVKDFFSDRGIRMDSLDERYDVYLETRDKYLGNFIYARELHKATTSYGNNWFRENFIDSDGRVRAHVTQCINTGRMAFNNPNLQQLPGEEVKKPKIRRVLSIISGGVFQWKHREAFIPAKGNVFVSGDFSGQEMGIMAAKSNEKILIDALLRGDDVHALTAYMINPREWNEGKERGCTYPKKCKCKKHIELREPAKIDNFQLAYGGGADALVDSIGRDIITTIDARMFIGAHKRITPALTRYLEKNGESAVRTGVSYSDDPYKRRRVLNGEETWQIRNQGKNTPIQAAGANMLKLAMISLSDSLPIVLVIHDQIILEVKKSAAVKAQKELKAIMEKSADYITGIKGLIKVNPTIQFNISKS